MSSRDHALALETAMTITTTRKENNYGALPTSGVNHCYTIITSEEIETPDLVLQTDEQEPFQLQKNFRTGWRFSMTCGLACIALTFLCNIIVVIWSSQQSRSDNNNFLLFSGDCNTMKTIDTWIHLAINILSTLLLGASNCAVQVLMAPTRKDINTAHALHKSVDIAVPSIANWTFMTLQKRLLFSILIITGLPLHLIYNSVIFSTDSAIEYQATAVSSNYLQHNPTVSPWNDAIPQNATFYNISQYDYSNGELYLAKAAMDQLWYDANNGSLIATDSDHCYDTLSNIYKSAYSNIILFTDFSSTNWSLLGGYGLNGSGGNLIPYTTTKDYWGCGTTKCSPDEWTVPIWPLNGSETPYTPQVTHCLMRQGQKICTVELVPKLLIIVIICNFLKGVALTYMVFSDTVSEPLLTLGDAIASFLEISDKHTEHQGGLMAIDTRRNLVPNTPRVWELDGHMHGWQQSHRRYFSGIPLFRWTVALQLFLSYYTFGLGLIWVYNNIEFNVNGAGIELATFSQQWQAGFGALFDGLFYQPQIFGDPTNALIANAIIANVPQLILSFIYVTCNGLFTYMSVSAEWAGYVQKIKRGLRVTNPTGQQRNTYWLSLPFKISVPLLVMSGTLHWLLSQSIYVVRLDFFTVEGTKSNDTINGIGWSPLMTSIFLAAAGILLLALLAFSLQKFPPGIPIVSSNSWAISANCHAIKPGESLQKLRYGVIKDLGDDKYRVGFSSGVVRPLAPGEHYR